MKKNKILMIVTAILFCMFVYLSFFPIPYFNEYRNNIVSQKPIGYIYDDVTISQPIQLDFESLDYITIQYVSFAKKIENGELEIKIVNDEKNIYDEKFNISDLSDNQILYCFFNSLSKKDANNLRIELN